MPKLSISEAARIADTTRSTLYRAMERGDISYEILNGKRVIDPSELQRAFPPERPKVPRKQPLEQRQIQDDTANEQSGTVVEQFEIRLSHAVTQRENELLREQLQTATNEIEYLRQELSKSVTTVKLLVGPEAHKTRSWWPWSRAA